MRERRKHTGGEPLKIVPLSKQEALFSDEELQALRELGEVLRPILDRLIAEEGFTLENGKLIKLPVIEA